MMKFDVWSRSATKALLGGLLAAALAGCGGGGGNAGTPVVGPGSGASTPSGGTPVATAADLVVLLSKSTITNEPTDSLTVTVTSVDANRVSVGGVPVSFAIANNDKAFVSAAGRVTDATTGNLTATITRGDDATPRAVTLEVTSGSVKRSVTFNVVQTSSPANPQANDLTLTLSASNIDNSGSRTVTATATAVDQNRNALAGIPVQLTVTDPSAVLIPGSTSNRTDGNGKVTGTVEIGQDRSNRAITVIATSGTLARSAAFQVTGARIAQASAVPAVVAAGAAGTIQYRVTDVNSNPMAGVTISVSGNGITGKTDKTDLNGQYSFTYTAPNAPGTSLLINAVAGGAEATVTVPIPTGGTTGVDPAAVPEARTLNLSADVVTVNTQNTNNQVTVNAFFRDRNNAPVRNVRVLFGVTGDNGTGRIAAGNNTVLSDASGTASTSYAPGAVSSPTNGVTVQACWKTTDFVPGDSVTNCAAAGGTLMTPATLTIVSNPVSITIGTDNTIGTGASTLTYTKRFVVLVVDSAGNPKADVQITPSVDLGGYGKGYWTFNALTKKWERSPDFGSLGLLTAVCPNEDLNRNGVIDGSSEDINDNKQLDPRKSDVSITLVGSTKTDANGVAVLQLEYPKNLASWVNYKVTVTAAGVLSPPAYYPLGVPVSLPSKGFLTELGGSTAQVVNYLYSYTWLPVAADAIVAEADPAFKFSPYGQSSSCTNAQ